MLHNMWLIPLFPMLAFIVVLFTKKYRLFSALTVLFSIALSFLFSVIALFEIILNPQVIESSIKWLEIPSFSQFRGLDIQIGMLIDPLSVIMISIVSFIALLVVLYSIGYMHDDEKFSKYFSYLALFTFSMLGLVISNNYFQILVFWELVGFCSYLLIGFWFFKSSAAEAGNKAFITNRWADFGFMVGIILLYVHFGSFNFRELANLISNSQDAWFITLAGLLIFLGPMGKSAQFPLHVWLPDAMEGPTPISALIHAATMVAAGVFLIARGYILFASSHVVLLAIAYIGGFTAIFAATIAIVQVDIKRILAYSTLSQLGYMIMVTGLGSITAGMFHLTTHAFFKALLFLGAGNVIHMLSEQNIFKMGGLKNKMPITTWTFIIGSLALSGVFPFAGFWSKDKIFDVALQSGHTTLFVIAIVTGFLTSLYMFRLIFIAFFGESKVKDAHEASWTMTLPLIILSFFAIFAGFFDSPWIYKVFGHGFGDYIYFGQPEIPDINLKISVIGNILAILGIVIAYAVYIKKVVSIDKIVSKFKWIYNLLYNKYYIDDLYKWIFDNVVLLKGKLFDWFDHKVIDGFFDGFAKTVKNTGRNLRLVQTGELQAYALVIFSSVVILVALAYSWGMGVIK